MNINWKKTGARIKRLMKKQDYSIGDISQELFISESTMKNYLYALTTIPIDKLCCMKEIFGLEKIEDLLVFEHEINAYK